MNEDDNLAGLLLLVCLVGVVMFICFALASLNLMASREELETPLPDSASLAVQRQDLLVQKRDIQQANAVLEENIDYVKKQIAQTAREIAALQETQPLDRTQEIQQLRQELDSLEEEKHGLLNQLNARRRDVNRFDVWRELGGTVHFQNPLFLECQARIILVHPGKKPLHMADLNRRNCLQEYIQGKDGIVLLVRPDGFNSFEAALLQVKKTNLKLAYEPVDAVWQLDFTQGP
ncbi:MAG: hypothetical protein FJ135_03910 [Deltaproteobacteria bacterium]|nr:hypothetical protein [Deltaproteobacteria bacterium]